MKSTYRYNGTREEKLNKALQDIRFYLGEANEEKLISVCLEPWPDQKTLTYSQAKELIQRTKFCCWFQGIEGFPVYALNHKLFQMIKNR